MKLILKTCSMLLLVGVIASCDDGLDPAVLEEQIVDTFEFNISSEDGQGVIELPSVALGAQVTDISVLNDPEGEFELLSKTFTTNNLNRGRDFHYIIYQAPDPNIAEDELLIELTLSTDIKVKVLARLSEIRDGHCAEEGGHNFSFKSLTYDVHPGDTVLVPLKADVFDLDNACNFDEELNYPNRGGEWRVFPIGEEMISVVNDRCCTLLGRDPFFQFPSEAENRENHYQVIIPPGKIGKFRFLSRLVSFKDDVDGALTGENVVFPNYTGDWPIKMLSQRLSLITFNVTD